MQVTLHTVDNHIGHWWFASRAPDQIGEEASDSRGTGVTNLRAAVLLDAIHFIILSISPQIRCV